MQLNEQRGASMSAGSVGASPDPVSTMDLLGAIASRWKSIAVGTVVCGGLGFGIASLLPPTYTARTVLLPPQQSQQGSAVAALASLGNLAGLTGGGAGKNSPEQYVALMQSVTVADRLIEQFKLQDVYDERLRQDARKELASNVRMSVGKKDGMITVECDDRDPKRAAEIANAFIEQLRLMSNSLAVTEAQQRRAFFEQQLQQTKANLVKAQVALQGAGISAGDLKAEPKAAAENYARLRASVTAAEVRLQSLAQMVTGNAPELAQQRAMVSALRAELARAEQTATGPTRADSDYITRVREFKYQETLFEMFARQYELARSDEAREGALIQVVDPATPPEKKTGPKKAVIALLSAFLAMMVGCLAAVTAAWWRRAVQPTGR